MNILKRLLLVLATLCASLLATGIQAQTCSIPGEAGNASIAAQPNTFFPGTGSPAAGATAVTTSTGTGVSSPLVPGDLVLIIQMQGTTIDTSTATNSYGSGNASVPGVTNTVPYSSSGGTGYAGGYQSAVAGNYEWAVVASGGATFAAGGTINLTRGLVNSYFTSAGSSTTGKQAWQVIRVPQYANLTLTGGLTVFPWNGSAGGLLVLEATGVLNLGGQTINGNGAGFRGAGAVNVGANGTCTAAYNTTGCQPYASLISQSLGGSKGEGMAGTPARLYTGDPTGGGGGTVVAGTADGYINGEASRGAPGNAGGGGNQHNAGGGGGGNGGAGGNGGNSWNSSNAAFVGLKLGGFGGAPSGTTQSRWVLGGAGGAGDIGGNTTTSPDGSGGAGGGMVILRASQVVGGGAIINVNGAPGQQSRATDAGGGGGSGGTVIIAAGSAGLSGALTVNANGGAGGAYGAGTNEQDGSGGGGGGGVLVASIGAAPTFNASGGNAGASNSGACPPASAGADCGQRAGSATSGSSGYSLTASPGAQVGYECLPALAVTKSTSTPVVTSSTGASTTYTVVITNTGGGARFAKVVDALPPGWILAAAPTYAYSAATILPTRAETLTLRSSATWPTTGTTPLTVPATGSNTLTWSSFAVAPVSAGVPGVMTITFRVTIPDTAAVGTYHNGAGVNFLDPTRAAASTRTVSPLTSNTANRTASAYGANTAYNLYAGASSTNVGGSNYDGTPAGPTTEDVQLVPDFSITKTGPATATPGATFTYTLTPRNNGRAVGSQTFTVSQATDVPTASVGTVLASSPLTVTDTLPASLTLTASFNGTGWSCTGTSPVVCTLPDSTAYPIARLTNFPLITATASISRPCSSSTAAVTNNVSISNGVGETVTGNNTATAVTTPTCASTVLTLTKTDASPSVVAGGTTSYTLTVSNTGATSAAGTVIVDPAVTGLSCTSVTCSFSGSASCPASPTIAALQGGGLTISPTFAAGSTVSFVVTCGVTATGQ